MKRPRNQKGFTVGIALVLAIVMAITVTSIAKLIDWNSHQAVYFATMNAGYRLAESGLNSAVSQLIKNPDLSAIPSDVVNGTQPGETYQNTVAYRAIPDSAQAIYIKTRAVKVVGGHSFTSTLHSYVIVSNVGDYFAAVNDSLLIGAGRDLSQGKVYAPHLYFERKSGLTTHVLDASYVDDLDPPLSSGAGDTDPNNDDWDSSIKSQIDILQGNANHVPRKLPVALVFPQIAKSDMDIWKTKAGPHVDTKCTFTGQIFPPGYVSGPMTGDTYGNHDSDNTHHIYYCTGPIYVQGTVHGQVLFVSEDNIYITGDLIRYSTVLDSDPSLPGGGELNIASSTAHQAALVTRSNVIIANTVLTSLPAPTAPVIQEHIQALVMAPSLEGTLKAQPYGAGDCGDPAYHTHLQLDFFGSMILGKMPSACKDWNLPNVFQAFTTDPANPALQNIYAYDASFKTNPPPYLPALAIVYYSFEEVNQNDGLFSGK